MAEGADSIVGSPCFGAYPFVDSFKFGSYLLVGILMSVAHLLVDIVESTEQARHPISYRLLMEMVAAPAQNSFVLEFRAYRRGRDGNGRRAYKRARFFFRVWGTEVGEKRRGGKGRMSCPRIQGSGCGARRR